ncbi:MAG: YhbY family RNA-binding protein [Chthoniobacterales bacterium]|nr:YhbY family RNA-binding protein [Chthoniobacterales bacterium]
MSAQEQPKLRELKARSQKLKPVIHVGHDGISAPLVAALGQALSDHGLVKVRFTDHKEDRKQLAAELAAASGSRIVLQVGHTVTLYRQPAA